MNTIGTALIAVAAALILCLSRRGAIVALLCGVFLIPFSEVVALGSLHFDSVRILLLVAFLRLVIRGECRIRSVCALDVVVLLHILTSAVAYVCVRGTMESAINRMGVGYEAVLSYLVIRMFVQDEGSWSVLAKTLVIICAVVAIGMTIEYATHKTIFASLVGLPDSPAVRNGRPRCQGPYQHAIIAGVFGGTSIPLCLALWWSRRPRKGWAFVGILSALMVVWASGSSTPAMCVIGAGIGMCMWFARRLITVIMLMLLASAAVLHAIMEDPVWALVARGGVFGGSTGYYRYLLIDLFIRNFDDWWLFGTDRYIEWSAAYGRGMWDACNMYVRQGIDGGLVTLVLFLILLWVSFRIVRREARLSTQQGALHPLMVWSLGAAVVAHCFAFIGLNYFDGQISAAWYMLLALIGSLRAMRQARTKPANRFETVRHAEHAPRHSVYA